MVVYGSGSREFALTFLPLIARNVSLHFFIVYNLAPEDRQRAQSALTALLVEGRMKHNIARRMPLSQIVAAHELVESGKVVGNVVLAVD